MKERPPIPRIVSPENGSSSLVAWGEAHRSEIDALLDGYGALLFRGFDVRDQDAFRAFVASISQSGPLEYLYGSTPRSATGDKVYTATEYPPTQTIPQHNEEAYQRDWPMRLHLVCLVAAQTGGETPITDTVRATERIDPEIRRRFDERGVLYVRNYHRGIDVPWEKVFATKDRGAVEAFCRRHDIEWEWRGKEGLRTKQRCQGLAKHPRTGETIWMNQAHLFHVSAIEPRARASLLELFKRDDLPRNAYYGDGGEIEEDVLAHVRKAFDAETVALPWQVGDVMTIDNMLVSHGRRPFTGPRRVLVAMSDPFSEMGGGAA